ncbi:MAG: hypothetical protein LBE13_14530, partial [Bacteroidales bacterium]|nr:hypothetical protein [Bacteroidales bacterium]
MVQRFISHILQEKEQDGSFSDKGLQRQFKQKELLISAIESFMLSNWDEIELTRGDNEYSNIVCKTLGYTLAAEETKQQLTELFTVIEKFIHD